MDIVGTFKNLRLLDPLNGHVYLLAGLDVPQSEHQYLLFFVFMLHQGSMMALGYGIIILLLSLLLLLDHCYDLPLANPDPKLSYHYVNICWHFKHCLNLLL